MRLVEPPADVFRRDCTNGAVLFNGTREPPTVAIGRGFRRLTGVQAPLHDYILDDAEPEFSSSPVWNLSHHDSGTWKAATPRTFRVARNRGLPIVGAASRTSHGHLLVMSAVLSGAARSGFAWARPADGTAWSPRGFVYPSPCLFPGPFADEGVVPGGRAQMAPPPQLV